MTSLKVGRSIESHLSLTIHIVWLDASMDDSSSMWGTEEGKVRVAQEALSIQKEFQALVREVCAEVHAYPLTVPCVCLKCYQTGLMSRYVESWRTGDTAFWRGPFGSFLYEPKKVSASTFSPEELPQVTVLFF